MDEIQAYKAEESAAMGQSLMMVLGRMYDCDPTEQAIKSRVYRRTDCGAWIVFTEKGVRIGSIVEGCDHDGTRSYDIAYSGDDEAFVAEYWRCLQLIEDEADALWHEWNDENGGEG